MGRADCTVAELETGPMPHLKYSQDYVTCVQDLAARDFLVNVGLPIDHVLFSALEAPLEERVEEVGGRRLLRVGSGSQDDEDTYCVDCANGEVVYLSRFDMSDSHVSASPRQFAECLLAFESEISSAASESDPELLEALSERVARRISDIDPSSLREDPGFWGSILFDVANGDYVEEED